MAKKPEQTAPEAATKPRAKAKPRRASRAKAKAKNGAGDDRHAQGGTFGGMGYDAGGDYLDSLMRMLGNVGPGPMTPQQMDSAAQNMTMVLGSGPAFAALESMFANTTAQSAILMNAAQTQRQLDYVGLCCTSACVKQLLNLNRDLDAD